MRQLDLSSIDALTIRYTGFRSPSRNTLDAKLKSGKNEYDYAGDHDVNCANSLFPQLGFRPCWYAVRHTDEQITIDSGNPNNPHLF